jgi:protein-S-isoprenylcysteine O-methyltransferase Ste14
MASPPVTQSQPVQSDADVLVRAGRWLFRQRTLTPIPLVVVILFAPKGAELPSAVPVAIGAALVACGEALRLWGVHHIGAISRTRSDRLGPLVDTGPFALARNPLYLGNIALWSGFALCARLVWLAPVIAVFLLIQYHAIVRWEEQLLTARLGDPYRAYQRRVPRWMPRRLARRTRSSGPVRRTPDAAWRDTLFSERGTLIAIAAGWLLLWVKSRF